MGITASASADVAWPQSQAVLPGGHYDVHVDAAEHPDNSLPIDAWPDLQGKRGWGCGRWGGGGWGAGEVGYGWGQGGWGLGPWGYGGLLLGHRTQPLADGLHTIDVRATDAAGNVAAGGHPEASLVVAGEPAAPEDLAADAYEAGVLALTFTLSRDDEDA